MKARGLVGASIVAALVSTVAIASAAQGSLGRGAVQMMDLRTFDTLFNKMINTSIREQGRPSAQAILRGRPSAYAMDILGAEACYTTWISVKAQTVRQGDGTPCKMTVEQNQILRDQVNRWLDRIYRREISDDQINKLKGRGPQFKDFFSETIRPVPPKDAQ